MSEIKRELEVGDQKYRYASLADAVPKEKLERLPFSIRILLENAIRNKDDFSVTDEHVQTLADWDPKGSGKDVAYKPSRVLMQDFTGVPAVVDLASLRAEVFRKGKDGARINPQIPVDLVVDHSVQVDFFGTEDSYRKNVEFEYQRNAERYTLLKWGQDGFDNFSVVPPGMGICHQVNLEYLAQGVTARNDWLFPDTLVGTDSHTPMVNGIGVLGWGVGGIEAEAAILDQPIYFSCPEVVGLKLKGKMPEGVTATDLVLSVTNLLREHGVVGKFVEVFGDGLDNLTVPDRATISNMSPEFGCTVTYFPIDDQTIDYMRRTNRSEEVIERVQAYCKANNLWRTGKEDIEYSNVVELDMSTLEPYVAGPKRPQDKIRVADLKDKFSELLDSEHGRPYVENGSREVTAMISEGGNTGEFHYESKEPVQEEDGDEAVAVKTDRFQHVKVKKRDLEYELSDGAVAIAAITSCTNTSNPSVMIGSGLVARKARELGVDVKPWVKTSLAPGSKVVTDYLEKADLLKDLEALRFHLVGYGCTTCIGNSGPLPPEVEKAVEEGDLVLSSVLSGNRNFEARVHPQVAMNFLASPMLVVAYAIAGRTDIDLLNDPLTYDPNGEAVYLKDLWPSQEEIHETIRNSLDPQEFEDSYKVIFQGEEQWEKLEAPDDVDYQWDPNSTYIKEAPFFKDISKEPEDPKDIENARVLLKLGDSVTTDHISPAGRFSKNSPAGEYLMEQGVDPADFNSYGSRRGNHEVMMRGTFANVRIKNELVEQQGGWTHHFPSGEVMSVYDAAMKYQDADTPLVVLAGKEYGSGSSRDWAAKGTYLLGVRAVIAESYERIHRSNLVGMGVLPLEYMDGQNDEKLGLDGSEHFSISGIAEGLEPGKELSVKAEKEGGSPVEFKVKCRLDSAIEIEYFKNSGILQYVLRQFLKEN